MEKPADLRANGTPPSVLSNAEIADRLAGLAQMLSPQKENPYKVKAYHRAAAPNSTMIPIGNNSRERI